jgi:aspartyl-tRNA(Asn)/glutamyl-tRNA(Gln) amidotransferase subunit B
VSTQTVDLVDYDEAVARFDPVIGIEVHVELGTATKMFDGAPQTFGAEPNTAVTPVSLGLPGALPAVNGTAVEYAIRIGLALNCEIAETCRFARKNYFYPDVPKNFQTSQYDEPIAHDGYLDVELEDGTVFRVEIERAHMEEDAGKNTHVGGATGRIQGAEYSLVDYNRAGIPLVEIVTKPITGAGERAPEVARAYVQTLRDIFRALGVSEARMERGNVRADVNVSLRPTPTAPLGTRTETKNVNSFRSVERSVRYEISRQAAILDAQGSVTQETRHWHEDTGITTAGRVKSDAEDYRYFPEPDLVPVAPSREWVEEIRAALPELPAARKWWMGELARTAKTQEVELAELPITPTQIGQLQQLVDAGRINDKLARQVLEGVLAGEGDPEAVVVARGLEVVSDDGPLLEAIDAALAAQPDIAEKIRGGNLGPVGAIIGSVMKATRGQADAGRVRELVLERVQA